MAASFYFIYFIFCLIQPTTNPSFILQMAESIVVGLGRRRHVGYLSEWWFVIRNSLILVVADLDESKCWIGVANHQQQQKNRAYRMIAFFIIDPKKWAAPYPVTHLISFRFWPRDRRVHFWIYKFWPVKLKVSRQRPLFRNTTSLSIRAAKN